MFGANYYGQAYYGQAYPIYGALVHIIAPEIRQFHPQFELRTFLVDAYDRTFSVPQPTAARLLVVTSDARTFYVRREPRT